MLTSEEMKELEQRLKDTICAVCVERGVDGSCKLWALDECPISLHLPGLVEVVRTVHSDSMGEYVDKVRKDVCSVCQSGLDPRGKCDVRGAGHCALDGYILLIVEVIDEFLTKKKKAKGA